jgi:hypothetical protein
MVGVFFWGGGHWHWHWGTIGAASSELIRVKAMVGKGKQGGRTDLLYRSALALALAQLKGAFYDHSRLRLYSSALATCVKCIRGLMCPK